MKFIIFGILTVLAAVMLLLFNRKYRKLIFLGYFVCVIAISAFYNLRLIRNIVPFYRPFSQTYYQPEFLEKGEYPDSLLPLLLQDKTVYTKNDPMDFEDAMLLGKDWHYGYYHVNNAVWYLELLDARVVQEDGMNGSMPTEEQIRTDFENMGPANDMFRYTFLCSKHFDEPGNYFSHFWYYADHLSEIDVYLNPHADPDGADIASAEELVMLWDSQEGAKEEENIYIMTKAYYEENVKQ